MFTENMVRYQPGSNISTKIKFNFVKPTAMGSRTYRQRHFRCRHFWRWTQCGSNCAGVTSLTILITSFKSKKIIIFFEVLKTLPTSKVFVSGRR